MEKSETIMKLAEALSKSQGMIKGAVKDSANPYFKSTYADLASVWEACRVPLTSNGLSIIQTTRLLEGKIILTTTLLHNSGEYISGDYPITPMRQVKDQGWSPSEDPQSLGSAITYARRYAMSAIIGIAPEDDDGEAAVGRGGVNGKKSPIPQPQENRQPPPEGPKDDIITEPQRKRFYAIAKKTGATDDAIKEWLLAAYGIEHTKDIPKSAYEEICNQVVDDFSEPGKEG